MRSESVSQSCAGWDWSSEAEELIRMLEHDIAKAPTHYGRQLPRIWEATD